MPILLNSSYDKVTSSIHYKIVLLSLSLSLSLLLSLSLSLKIFIKSTLLLYIFLTHIFLSLLFHIGSPKEHGVRWLESTVHTSTCKPRGIYGSTGSRVHGWWSGGCCYMVRHFFPVILIFLFWVLIILLPNTHSTSVSDTQIFTFYRKSHPDRIVKN